MDDVKITDTKNVIHQVNCYGFGEKYATRNRTVVFGYNSEPIAEISVAPSIYIHELSIGANFRNSLSLQDIQTAIKSAAENFLSGTISGLSPEDYMELTHRATGLPRTVIQSSFHYIGDALKNISDTVRRSLPNGIALNPSGEEAYIGTGICSRKGDVLSVVAAGNGPGLHALWPQAVALGYRTIVKPSSNEPFTAQRLVETLAQAGLSDYVSLCCTDHHGVKALLDSTDLGIVYGGRNTVEQYSNFSNILVQGPGYSKVVVTSEVDENDSIEHAANSVMSLGGAACVSASVIYVEGNVEKYASKLAKYFKREQFNCLYPKVSKKQILDFKQMLKQYDSDGNFGFHAEPTNDGITITPYVDYSFRDCVSLRHRELPFPCVAVLPLNRQTISEALRGSLAVSVYSKDLPLINNILQSPGISNVYVGPIPTTWMATHVPHDGYLSEFIIKTRGYRIHKNWIETEKRRNL
ncbi:MAG: aldehyde dehydrogenase family protein [Aliivibrio sp.]|uniref:aldehyde dehydrogenase family protein n=1 Tax=Aliivibrio sp. TaxID=1872443 RepID=UPI001A3E2725|nr:aldehyde dehydrogenase family protein [Aliivibrio sp.]